MLKTPTEEKANKMISKKANKNKQQHQEPKNKMKKWSFPLEIS